MRRIVAGSVSFGAFVAMAVGVGPVTEAQPSGGAVAGSTTIELQVAGENGVPADASMAAVHVGVARAAGSGFVTLWPCEGPIPTTSVVNHAASQLTQSLVLSKLSAAGSICLTVSETTDAIVDLAGYVPAGSDLTALDAPVRVVDTRRATRLRAGEEFRVQLAGEAGIAADAGGAAFTLTAVGGADPGFITSSACGAVRPETSTVNWAGPAAVPNFVISKLGDGGAVCLVASSDVHVLVDVVASMPADAAGLTLLDTPDRVFDSRIGRGGPQGPFGPSERRTVDVRAPADAVAVLGNLTAARQASNGFATAFPCTPNVPFTASLNWSGPGGVANGSLAKLDASGDMCLLSSGTADLIYDVSGFVTSEDFFTPLTPVRLSDSREGWEADCPFTPIALSTDLNATSAELVLLANDGDQSDDRRVVVPSRLSADVYGTALDCSVVVVRALFEFIVVDVATGRITDRFTNFNAERPTVVDDRVLAYLASIDATLPSGSAGVRYEVRDLSDDAVLVSSGVFPRLGDTYRINGQRFERLAENGDTVVIVHGQGEGRAEANALSVTIRSISEGWSTTFPIEAFDGVSTVDVAPDGATVVLSGQGRGVPAQQPTNSRYLAYSLNGDVVARADGLDGGVNAAFLGRGRIHACTTNALILHDLFAPAPFVVERFGADAPFGNSCIGR
ncbi:MAG: hypothetical protein AAGD33_23810 [Actinomycetota bacterium]